MVARVDGDACVASMATAATAVAARTYVPICLRRSRSSALMFVSDLAASSLSFACVLSSGMAATSTSALSTPYLTVWLELGG